MRKEKVLVVSALTTALVIAGGFAIQGNYRAAQYEQLLETNYTHAYLELTTAVSELDTALQKLRYTTTPALKESLCTDLYGKAVAAQMALGELPDSAALLEQTSAFLARTGDYALSLARSSAIDNTTDEETYNTLRQLSQVSSILSTSLLELRSHLDGGTVSITSLLLAEQALNNADAAAGGTSFQTVEADFPEVPSLIYDGPFSEHLSSRTARALEELPHISRDKAHTVAASFLGISPSALQFVGTGEGVLPTWNFTSESENDQCYIEVTQQGGKVLSLLHSRPVWEQNLTIPTALQTAQTFLNAHGYRDMRETYHIRQNNVLTINYAVVQDHVLCYPDLIKVSVALDDGSILGFESHGWIMNHEARTFAAPAIPEETARNVVSPHLEILSHQLALIPTAGEYEVLCHEFKCRTDENTHIIVYINATTGSEEKILLLLENERGTLVL